MITRQEFGVQVFCLDQLLAEGTATTRGGTPLRVVAYVPEARGQSLVMFDEDSKTVETYDADGTFMTGAYSVHNIVN